MQRHEWEAVLSQLSSDLTEVRKEWFEGCVYILEYNVQKTGITYQARNRQLQGEGESIILAWQLQVIDSLIHREHNYISSSDSLSFMELLYKRVSGSAPRSGKGWKNMVRYGEILLDGSVQEAWGVFAADVAEFITGTRTSIGANGFLLSLIPLFHKWTDIVVTNAFGDKKRTDILLSELLDSGIIPSFLSKLSYNGPDSFSTIKNKTGFLSKNTIQDDTNKQAINKKSVVEQYNQPITQTTSSTSKDENETVAGCIAIVIIIIFIVFKMFSSCNRSSPAPSSTVKTYSPTFPDTNFLRKDRLIQRYELRTAEIFEDITELNQVILGFPAEKTEKYWLVQVLTEGCKRGTYWHTDDYKPHHSLYIANRERAYSTGSCTYKVIDYYVSRSENGEWVRGQKDKLKLIMDVPDDPMLPPQRKWVKEN